jgi:hypothetical protein
MSTIVAISDFRGEILIANKIDLGVGENVTWFIDKYEPIFLRTIFGADFATLFTAGLAEDPIPQRWTDLLTPNGYDLKTAIANYIYYWYQRDQDTQTVGVGTVKTSNQNAVTASAADKVTRAWLEMMVISWQTLRFLNTNVDVYPEFTMPNWFNCFCLNWTTWGFADDIFGSEVFYGFYGLYRIPDIFKPINKFNI